MARLELPHAGQHTPQQVQRFEARDHHRYPAGRDPLAQFVGAHHRADMASSQEALHRGRGGGVRLGGQQGLHGRRHPHVGREDREVGQALGQGAAGQQGRGRRRGLEPHRQHHHLPPGVGAGQLQGLDGGGDQAHIGAGGPGGEQARPAAAGHPQHVAVGAEDHLRPPGQGLGCIQGGGRGHTHRAAGAMDQAQAGGQQLIEAPAQDRVGLATAHLHQGPGPGGDGGKFGRQLGHSRRNRVRDPRGCGLGGDRRC